LLLRAARHAAAAEGFRAGCLSIAVVGTRRMATLHERFLGVAGPTDVITFDFDTDRTQGWLEGEIVVCADVAARAAAGQVGAARLTHKAVHRELALYVVHGILHLAGYDDRDPDDYARMHAREDQLLSECGVGAVFAAQSKQVRK